jgi:hypothetical protein
MIERNAEDAMSHYLVYRQSYWEDYTEGYRPDSNHTTDSKKMHNAVRRGDWLWVVISGGIKAPEEWRLIERIYVQDVDPKPSPMKWGKWHFKGNKSRSQIFSVISQPDLTAILWLLTFASGKRIKFKGKKIGQALQANGFRPLSEHDCILLEEYGRTLKANDKVPYNKKDPLSATQLELGEM